MQDIIFSVLVLAFSAILHEVAHGYMANYLGDPTARLQGRLTLNPLKHIDPLGSIILPAFMAISGWPPIGYAKPVPYNPYNLQGKYDEGLIAFAGPATNMVIALLFGLLIRFGQSFFSPTLLVAFATICIINISLAIINLIPVPPIDGSKILNSILDFISPNLGYSYSKFKDRFTGVGFFLGIAFLYLLLNVFGAQYFALLRYLFVLLTGASL
jgi:Zn-dependent protease